MDVDDKGISEYSGSHSSQPLSARSQLPNCDAAHRETRQSTSSSSSLHLTDKQDDTMHITPTIPLSPTSMTIQINRHAQDLSPAGDDHNTKPEITELDLLKLDKDRDTWGKKTEFILASVGLAVGLGNVWRFPYLCQKNGGGAFLIPYIIMMIIEGIPLFYIEFAIGQRFQRSAIGCWKKIHPALLGIGISCIVISMMLCIYYIVIISWSFYYLFVSLTNHLPWSADRCPGYNNYKVYADACSKNSSDVYHCKLKSNFSECCVHDPQLYYFYRKALDISPSIENSGNGMNGKLVGCLLMSWVLVYVCVVKGVKSSGKAVYFTATFPYIILIILFFVGVTLDGAVIGLKAYFEPKWERLADPKIWMDAATQMFFTLSLGFGALISFASYMPIKNNCVRDAYTVVLINCGTSFFAGIVVFSILGHREYVTKIPVETIGGGPGLAFITFCDAFLQIPASPLWSFLFFMMLILLGIDSEFGTFEGLIAPFYDMKWIKIRKEIFTGILAVLMFFVGLSLVSSQGYYVFQMFDDYSVNLPLLFIAFFQVIAVSWIYGNDKFANDIEYMTGSRPSIFWMICWKYISPLAIFIIFVANCHSYVTNKPTYTAYVGCFQQLVNFSNLSIGTKDSTAKLEYPDWCKLFLFIFVTCSMAPIIVWLVKDVVQYPQSWLNGFKNKLLNPIEYHPDPCRIEPSRRKSLRDMECQILQEMEEEDTS